MGCIWLYMVFTWFSLSTVVIFAMNSHILKKNNYLCNLNALAQTKATDISKIYITYKGTSL